MHKQQRQRLQARDAAASSIQRAFRGWRTRRRVVLQVRDDMELLVADIRRQLDGAWALLGPSSFSMDWGDDGALRLPRMEDSLFGVSVHFPPEHEEQEEEQEEAEDSCSGSVDEEVKSSREQQAAIGPPSQPIAPLEAALEDEVVGAQARKRESEGDALHGISSKSDAGDDGASAVEIRALQAETSACEVLELECQVEDMDGAPLQRGQDGDAPQLASVQGILATHSREEILLELQWARQALRDRRKYLRSKKRIEQGPEPLACA
ncbi:IQ motif, EF-hand binding site [Phytophthora cinnamomi]|uniref:IQ motif, EF-hand binding site n=1 Tax=Phytophthora cinnamomi TaxID=4785 RepID=UPI003559BEEB|nr:IQ motif, EF-hand binding site [Phytophthora cinnamomi]